MSDLVIMENNEIFTTSQAIADGVGHGHSTVLKLIRNSTDLCQLRDLKSRSLKTKGRTGEVFYLDEEQATLVIMLMKNTSVVRQFKSTLAKEFFKQRRLLQALAIQKSNVEWMERRQETKIMRRELTDTIQEFIEYARAQGSKSADKYYMNFSRMELTGLFIIEQRYPNARDVMSVRQLNLIEMADQAIAISLRDSMEKEIPYKECYQIAKDKISLLVKIFPRSPLPQLLGCEEQENSANKKDE